MLTDGASAAQLAAKSLSTFKCGLHRCYAHLFQLVAGDVLRVVDGLLSRILAFLALFARSSILQDSIGLRIPTPARTRWLSWSTTLTVLTKNEAKIVAWSEGQGERTRGRAPTPAEYATMRRLLPVLEILDKATQAAMRDDASPADMLKVITETECALATSVEETESDKSSDEPEEYDMSDGEAVLVDVDVAASIEAIPVETLREAAARGLQKREKYVEPLRGAALFDPAARAAELLAIRKRVRLIRGKKEEAADYARRVDEEVIVKAVRLMQPWLPTSPPVVTHSECTGHPLANWLRLPADRPACEYWAVNEISSDIRAGALRALGAPVSSTANERVFSMLRDVIGVRGGNMGPKLLHSVAVLRHALTRDPSLQIRWKEDGRKRAALSLPTPPAVVRRMVAGQQKLGPPPATKTSTATSNDEEAVSLG